MIKVKEMVQTCVACPVQFEGHDTEDNYIYIRERHESLRVDYLEHGNTIFGPVDCPEFATLEVIKEKTREILDWSEAAVIEIEYEHNAEDEESFINWLEETVKNRENKT